MKFTWKLGPRCRGNIFICESITQQRYLYICLTRGRCPATGLHLTISLILDLNCIHVTTILKATDKYTQAVKFLNCIQGVFGLNLDLGADCYKIVHDFLRCALENAGTVPQIRPRTLPFISFPIHIIS